MVLIVWALEAASWFVFSKSDPSAQASLAATPQDASSYYLTSWYPLIMATLPLGWFILAVLFYGVGSIFRTSGSLIGLLAALGFAQVPGLINVATTGVTSLFGTAGAGMGALASLLLGSWGIALQIIAIRESMSLSTGKAIATWILTAAVFFGLLLMLALGVVLFTGIGV